VTGGWGPNEAFGEPGTGQLGDSLRTTHASFETPCGAYGHFKIARYLLQTTKDARYGDSMERVLYNTILGAWPIQADGTSFYYSDYGTTGRKDWYRNKWPCCSGTFPQLAADYHVSTYLKSADGVYVNLFAPSTVRWIEGAAKCALTQQTNYPFDGKITIMMSASVPVETTVYVRIPAWATRAPVLSINGARVTAGAEPGTFAAIRRTWTDGDRIELELPMPLRLEPVDVQHSNQQALVRGPLVLFAVADTQPSFERTELLRARPAGDNSGDCTVTSAEGKDVVMRPFMTIKEESYSTYLQVKA
jgi:uncharacterized protein